MTQKKALITGITGQDGAYLAQFLLSKNYEVYGGERQNASGSLWRLNELKIEKDIKIVPFELLEENNIHNVIKNGKFNEIYNLAAQSFVANSYETPVFTSNVNALGVTRILEAIRLFSSQTKLYQASTSEMFGNSVSNKQNEITNFQPTSPYAISKLHSHWMIKLYRDAYNIFCCSGILFNHESPLRGKEFVTKKIISDLAKIKYGLMPSLKLGNIYAERDWGYAKDYVEAIWKMLQLNNADDFVISSGRTHTVKSFVDNAAKEFGFDLVWRGKGLNEKAYDKKTKKLVVQIEKKFFRPTEVNHLFGDYKKAKKVLKWSPKTDLKTLIKIMCEYEISKYQ